MRGRRRPSATPSRASVTPALGLLILFAVLAVVLVAGCARGPATQVGPQVTGGTVPGDTGTGATRPADTSGASFIEVTLVRVVDGDTIWVRVPDGSEEKVRYIGIDAPEIDHPDAPGEYLGDESSIRNAHLLESGPLRLQLDVEERDPYGRILAYVWAGDLFVNERLVLDGYARAHSYPPNLGRQPQLQEAQQKAQAAGLGIWAPTATT